MKRLAAMFLMLSCALAGAQDYASMPDRAFRRAMYGIVSDGTCQYMLSSRAGIKAAADSLADALAVRSLAGKLAAGDSLEFTADLYKLKADWHYENAGYYESSLDSADLYLKLAADIYARPPFVRDADLRRSPMIRRELAQLRYRQGRFPEALDCLEYADSAYRQAYMQNVFIPADADWTDWLDIRMQKALCLARLSRPDEAVALADSLLAVFPEGSEQYYEALRKKGKILLLAGDRNGALRLYRKYFAWRRDDALGVLAGLSESGREDYWMRMRPFVADAYLLESADAGLLYDIALMSKNLVLQMNLMSRNPDALRLLSGRWQDVQKALPPKSAAVEFIQYAGKMAALVVRSSGKPQWFGIMSAGDFMSYEIAGRPNGSRMQTTWGGVKNDLYTDKGLRDSIWTAGLVSALAGCSKIYFAPDGYLHQLAIEYMLPPALASAEVFRLTSTRRLLERREAGDGTALIAGGVRYDCSPGGSSPAAGNDADAYRFMRVSRASFPYLKGSLTEARSIYGIRAGALDTLLVGDEVTEERFRSLAGRYSILSLSTHGYFDAAEVPQGTDLKTCMEDETLSRSILALAGANTSLADSRFDPDMPDGLLSAAELSRMDLSGVDLAVLAACQTGLGYITADGVYGIQRGFKNAGAGSLLVSLWNVDDAATMLMMTAFHENLRKGKTLHRAFMDARSSLARKRTVRRKSFNSSTLRQEVLETQEDYYEPRYMNAFVLIDAI